MHDSFPAHGKARLEITGRIARLQVEGHWNEQLVDQTHDALRETLRKHLHGPWAMMVVFTTCAVCGPEALDVIRSRATDEASATHRVATAWVVPPGIEGADLAYRLIDTAYAGINMARAFASETDAERWLSEVLDTVKAGG